jgi:Uma2 family endonuclease
MVPAMNALTRALETADQYRFTLDDVLKMQDAGILDPDARVELIDGGLIEMAPEGLPHARAKMQLNFWLVAHAGPHVSWVVDTTLRLSATSAPDPDLYLFSSDLPLERVDGQSVGLVIEIADASLRKDLSAKAELYAAHGVRDYWVIDLAGAAIVVHRDPAGEAYRDITRVAVDQSITTLAFPELSLSLSNLPTMR